jgi:hypothetical protein
MSVGASAYAKVQFAKIRDEVTVPKERTRERSGYLKTAGQSPATPKGKMDPVDEKTPDIRYASAERLRDAHRKTNALHAGLFRRLAE